MSDEQSLDDRVEGLPPVRRRNMLGMLGLFSLVLLALLAVAWFQRTKLADHFIRRELDRRDIRATYQIEEIGFRTQRLRNLVMGDPARPDLVVRHAELVFQIGLDGVRLTSVKVDGVRLNGAWGRDGTLSFGDLDKLRDPESKEPLELPDLYAELRDGQMRLDTPYGALGLGLNGKGRLRDGFAGHLAMVGKGVSHAGCAAANPAFRGKLSVQGRQPTVDGQLLIDALDCAPADLAMGQGRIGLSLTLGERLDEWRGRTLWDIGSWQLSALSARGLTGEIGFSGQVAKAGSGAAPKAGDIGTNFDIDLVASTLSHRDASVRTMRLTGQAELGLAAAAPAGEASGAAPASGNFSFHYDGRAEMAGARLSVAPARRLRAGITGLAGTPLEPLAVKLVDALERAGEEFSFQSGLDLAWNDRTQEAGAQEAGAQKDGGLTMRLIAPNIRASGGARIESGDTLSLRLGKAGLVAQGDGAIRMTGGGLPDALLRLRGAAGGPVTGEFMLARYAAGGASLGVPSLRFAMQRGGGVRFSGMGALSGPLLGGRLEGGQIPLSGSLSANGQLFLYEQCQRIGFARLALASLDFRDQSLRLCPAGRAVYGGSGGFSAYLDAPVLTGRMGSAPAGFRANRLDLDAAGFAARGLAIRIGAGEDPTRFDSEHFTGAFGGAVPGGAFSGAEGKIANVPLLLEQAQGQWTFAKGRAEIKASALVNDAAPVDRFRTMRADAMALAYEGDVITMTGQLNEPVTGRRVADVTVRHAFGPGSGQADLDVAAIRFDPALQPDMLTPLALGVVANVEGTMRGKGQINWSPEGVTSTGEFTADNANLAAAFGPVTGLGGTIRFTDLLGLQTAPGQTLSLATVNPGIAVLNGEVRYQLLPDNKVRIEGARWPFAGGELVLRPTVMDLGVDKPRALTFEMRNMDAAQFLREMDFENLDATGVFDGVLPMVFDQDGGRIVGGRLVSRPGGGSLAYVGQLSYENLGPYGNFAFNALKSVRYRELTIIMDGEIDGEIITQVNFSGLQQGEGASRNFITRQLAKLPIQFNVRITAPFMQLMNSVKGYYDPSLLVGQNLPLLLQAQQAAQNAKNEKSMEKNGKTGVPGANVQKNESGGVP